LIHCPHFRAPSGDVHPPPQTRNRNSGTPYVTYRLVHSACVGSSVKQSTLLNLGSHFDLPQREWPALAARIDQLVRDQGSLVESTLPDVGQALAQRYVAQLISLQPSAASITPAQAARAASPTSAAASSAGDAERFQDCTPN